MVLSSQRVPEPFLLQRHALQEVAAAQTGLVQRVPPRRGHADILVAQHVVHERLKRRRGLFGKRRRLSDADQEDRNDEQAQDAGQQQALEAIRPPRTSQASGWFHCAVRMHRGCAAVERLKRGRQRGKGSFALISTDSSHSIGPFALQLESGI
eukprot:scaffold1154_cov310-Pinguiococcus_pyrenoidosus.AAC.4